MMQRCSKSPLPFLGQKRNWIKVLEKINFSNKTVIDLFGGSGLVTHAIKYKYPDIQVVWNDYDNFNARLSMINETEILRSKLFSVGIKKAKRVSEQERIVISEMIDRHIMEYGRADWITISSWLLFSGNYAHNYEDLMSRTWYFQVVKNPINANGYLVGVERRSCDFRELFNEYKDQENVIFIADPPYIMTNQSGYVSKGNGFFRLKDGVELIQKIHDKPTLFFSSPKSETDSLFEIFNPMSMKKIVFETSIGNNKITDLLYLLNMDKEIQGLYAKENQD